jgi:hypothetical protein
MNLGHPTETQRSTNQNRAFGSFKKKNLFSPSQLFASLFVILHPRKPLSKFPIVCDESQLDNMIFPSV